MILGTTNSPALVAGITEINAASAREEAYKSQIAQLEEALADATGTLAMYRAVCGITLDDCERLRKMVAEDVHLISKSYRDGYREGYEAAQIATALRLNRKKRGR
ncbi:MAG: hypothetical protein MR418_03405 [Clostridiales bacterium]|nr:hypothetical protein [Clostridiales bacterium]MDY4199287.1 hypothetical protein [Candidatus Fimadaptatus sp.]